VSFFFLPDCKCLESRMSAEANHGSSTQRSPLPPTLLERCDGSHESRVRVARTSQPEAAEASCAVDHSRGGSPMNQGGVLRKKLYDQNVADWSARYKKNKQTLENLKQDCEVLRSDVAKQQQEVDERAETFRQLDDAIPTRSWVVLRMPKNRTRMLFISVVSCRCSCLSIGRRRRTL